MSKQRRMIDLIAADGSLQGGELTIRVRATNDPDRVQLILDLPDRQFRAVAVDGFEALIALRLELEPLGLAPVCWGASLQVYPSDASRSVGIGDSAYRLTLGQFARAADRVNIFDAGPGLVVATVAEQEDFSRAWFDSLADALPG